MARRAATVTQADVARAIRAAKREGMPIAGVHVGKEGAVIIFGEPRGLPDLSTGKMVEKKPVPVL